MEKADFVFYKETLLVHSTEEKMKMMQEGMMWWVVVVVGDLGEFMDGGQK